MFTEAAKRLNAVVSLLPADKVQQVRGRMDGYVRQGGVHHTAAEKSTLEKTLDVAAGKALPSDFKKTDEEVKAEEERKKQEDDR